MQPDLPAMMEKADAALLIGDPALKFAVDGTKCNKTSGASNYFVYDIVEKWRALTSLPAVLAVWAARPEAVTKEVVRDFQDSLAFGIKHVKEIADGAAPELKLPAEELRRYLTQNIDYTLDSENLRGLRRYYDLATEIRIIPQAREIVMAEEAVRV